MFEINHNFTYINLHYTFFTIKFKNNKCFNIKIYQMKKNYFYIDLIIRLVNFMSSANN
jgi:hypothetical protein